MATSTNNNAREIILIEPLKVVETQKLKVAGYAMFIIALLQCICRGGLHCKLNVCLAARPAQTIICLLKKQVVTNIRLLGTAHVF